jgi:hypothetical protein
MTQQHLNFGSQPDALAHGGTPGDTLDAAMIKVEANTTELYTGFGGAVINAATATSIESAIGQLFGGGGTVIVPKGFSETIVNPIVVSGNVRVIVDPAAQLTIGAGGSITLINTGVWDQAGGTLNVTKTSGDAVIMSGGWSRFTVAQLNYTGGAGTTNGVLFSGAQFSRIDVGQIKGFGGTALIFGRNGSALSTINNRATVEFINNCGSLVMFASGTSGTDVNPFCEGNRVFGNLFSVFTTAGITFGDNGTLHDSQFNECHSDVHDTSVGGIVPVIFNDGTYSYFDGSTFSDHGTVKVTCNALASFNVIRAANVGLPTNVSGAGVFQNLFLSELLFQVPSINSGTTSPIRLGNNARLTGYKTDNVTPLTIGYIGADNLVHIGDGSLAGVNLDTGGFGFPVTVTAPFATQQQVTLASTATNIDTSSGVMVGLAAGPSTALTSTIQRGIFVDLAGNASATSRVNAIEARVRTAAAAFTTAFGAGLYVLDAAKGAGSTITALYGVRVAPLTQGGSNVAIFIDSQTGTAIQTNAGVSQFGDRIGLGVVAGAAGLSVQYGLNVNLSGQTAQTGISVDWAGDSTATVAIRGIFARAQTQAAAFTCGQLADIYIANPVKGSGSTITAAYGILMEDITSGSANRAIQTGKGVNLFGDATYVGIGVAGTPVSGVQYRVPAILYQNANQSTTSTTDASVASFSLPGTSLGANVQAVRITARGRETTQAGSFNVKFGATVLGTVTPAAGAAWVYTATVTRTSATAQLANVDFIQGATAGTASAAPAETLSGAITIDFRGSVTSGGTLFVDYMMVEFLSAA